MNDHSLWQDLVKCEQSRAMLNHKDCPRYMRCNAPKCPAAANYKTATRMQGEPVCFYFTAALLRPKAK